MNKRYIKVYQEIELEKFEWWGGAIHSIERAEKLGILEEVFDLIEEIFTLDCFEEITEVALNDFVCYDLFEFWFDWETGERLN